MRGKVAVIGVGMIKYGELFDKSLQDMIQEAYLNCLKNVDKGIDPKDIKAGWFGQWSGGFIGQGIQGGQSLAAMVGNLNMTTSRIENACPTGGDTFRNACIGVASGAYDVVLALGAEKMRDKPSAESLGGAGGGGGAELSMHPSWVLGQGGPAIQAMHATRMMHDFGYTMEDFARVAVKNHHNGTLCPYAHMQFEINIDRVLNSPIICWPLHLFDCCPQTDGAAAAILCRADLANKYSSKPIYVLGTHTGMDHHQLWDRKGFTSQPSVVRAGKGAFDMAGIKPSDVDFAELHDCFTNTELMNIEDLGFARPGESAKKLKDGEYDMHGKFPVNPSGGLKAHGHPIAATGLGQVFEVVTQLREEADKRQVKIKNGIGIHQNVGGPSFGACAVNILSRTR